MAKIVILGSGGFGTSLAVTFHKFDYDVTLWSISKEEINGIRAHGENKKLLPGIAVDSTIELTTDISCVSQADVLVFAVPSFAVRSVVTLAKDYVKSGCVVVNVGKGFEDETLKRLSEVLTEELPSNPVVVLSGPSHAEEIARGVPTTLVAASSSRESAEYIQDLFMCSSTDSQTSTSLRIYVNDDVIGVELGGALKNIIALCAGIADGLGLGDNTKAALITRGLAEIARLGVAMGAKAETFAGLTGVGDLIVTCMSMHSRNRRAGIFMGQGLSAKEAVKRVGMTVEGCMAAKSAYKLSQKYDVCMPIVEQLYEVIENDKDIKETITDLMDRPGRHENEKVWLKTIN